MPLALTDKSVKSCCFPKLFQLRRNKQKSGSENLLSNGELKRVIYPGKKIRPKADFSRDGCRANTPNVSFVIFLQW